MEKSKKDKISVWTVLFSNNDRDKMFIVNEDYKAVERIESSYKNKIEKYYNTLKEVIINYNLTNF